jgi:hypothetical protein
VLDWLADLNSGEGQIRELLEFVKTLTTPASRYSYGGYTMMADIVFTSTRFAPGCRCGG